MAHPSELIESISKSYIHAETVYTMGGCYQFYLILKTIFPDAIAYYSPEKGHVVTMIDGTMYDIKGVFDCTPDLIPLSSDPGVEDEATTWRFDWGMVGTDFGEVG